MTRKVLKKPRPNEVLDKTDSNSDYTGDAADNRFLRISIWGMKYGTNDKVQGAALMIGLLLMISIVFVTIGGFWATTTDWAERVLQTLGPILTLVIGVAIGKSSSGGDAD